MPAQGVPVPDISPQLYSLLMRSVGWLVSAALAAGLAVWLLDRSRSWTSGRLHEMLSGTEIGCR